MTIKSQLKFLIKIEEYFIGIGILAITVILFLNVVLRYVFNDSIEWAEEVTRYGIIWITFIGASVCIYKGAHLGIDTLILALEKRGIKALTFIVRILTIVFSIVFLIRSTHITMKLYGTDQLSSAMKLPMYLDYGYLRVRVD